MRPRIFQFLILRYCVGQFLTVEKSLILVHPWKLPYASPKNHPKKVQGRKIIFQTYITPAPSKPTTPHPPPTHLLGFPFALCSWLRHTFTRQTATFEPPVWMKRGQLNLGETPMCNQWAWGWCNEFANEKHPKYQWTFHGDFVTFIEDQA